MCSEEKTVKTFPLILRYFLFFSVNDFPARQSAFQAGWAISLLTAGSLLSLGPYRTRALTRTVGEDLACVCVCVRARVPDCLCVCVRVCVKAHANAYRHNVCPHCPAWYSLAQAKVLHATWVENSNSSWALQYFEAREFLMKCLKML